MWGDPSGTQGLELTQGVRGAYCQLKGHTTEAEVKTTQGWGDSLGINSIHWFCCMFALFVCVIPAPTFVIYTNMPTK